MISATYNIGSSESVIAFDIGEPATNFGYTVENDASSAGNISVRILGFVDPTQDPVVLVASVTGIAPGAGTTGSIPTVGYTRIAFGITAVSTAKVNTTRKTTGNSLP